jgi:hypothetical protein
MLLVQLSIGVKLGILIDLPLGGPYVDIKINSLILTQVPTLLWIETGIEYFGAHGNTSQLSNVWRNMV